MSEARTAARAAPALVEVRDLHVHFRRRRSLFRAPPVKAVDGVSFDIREGETLALVGESGCGKSTCGRAILRLLDLTSGSIRIGGTEIAQASQRRLRPLRPDMQMVFQDAQSSLDPRMTVAALIGEPLDEHARLSRPDRQARIHRLMESVGLSPRLAARYPHQVSGGQRQRIGIARALALNPRLVICDEPISALDISVQAQVVNLLEEVQDRLGLTYLFISHDLSMVRHIADRVAVMYLGRLAELGPAGALFAEPLHPYTRALLSAVPEPDPDYEAARQPVLVQGDVPAPDALTTGCSFAPRCPWAIPVCRSAAPAWTEVLPGRWLACHRFADLNPGRVGRTDRFPEGRPT
jgi:oligopeptide transport system ATP-binding protein